MRRAPTTSFAVFMMLAFLIVVCGAAITTIGGKARGAFTTSGGMFPAGS